jgi:hypothetical protein
MSPRNAAEVGQRRSYEYRGVKYPSVTTLLKAWPMEWAIAYGAKHVAERAMTPEGIKRILDMEQDPYVVLRWLKAAPFERRDAAADAGTIRHGYLEDRLNGYAVPDGELSPAEQAIEQFLDAYRPEPLYVEAQVVNQYEGYAGSADAFVRIYGRTYVLDLKTANYAATDHKARLQLAAYRYADVVFEDDRDLGPVPPCDGALVLVVPRDDPRSWQPIEVAAGPVEFQRFLDYKRAWQFYDATKDTGIGELLLPQAREAQP